MSEQVSYFDLSENNKTLVDRVACSLTANIFTKLAGVNETLKLISKDKQEVLNFCKEVIKVVPSKMDVSKDTSVLFKVTLKEIAGKQCIEFEAMHFLSKFNKIAATITDVHDNLTAMYEQSKESFAKHLGTDLVDLTFPFDEICVKITNNKDIKEPVVYVEAELT